MQGIGFYAVICSFLFGVLYASYFFTSLPIVLFLVVIAVIFGSAWVTTRRKLFSGMCLILGAFSVGALRTALAPTELPSVFEPYLEHHVTVEGVVVSQPDRRETGSRLTVKLEKGEATARVIAVTPPHEEFTVGDRVSVTGVLKLPEPFETDGGRTFAYDAFLAKDGVFGVMQPAQVTITGRGAGAFVGMRRALQHARDGFTRALNTALPEPESALASGLVTGGKQGLGKELIEAFTVAGLVHIVVLSGYNVMIVAESILRALRRLPHRLSFTLAGLSIALFVMAAGAGAAATRAGMMALLGLVARATGRTYAVVRALFATLVLMLLWSPLALVHDPGLQFSFIATLGLIVGAPLLAHRLLWIRSAGLREIIASTVAAQLGVLPILLYQTGNLSPFSLIANILVLPFIPLAMGLSVLAALIAFLTSPFTSVIGLIVGLPGYAVLAYIIAVAQAMATLPFSHAIVPAFPFWLVIATYAALAWLVLHLQKRTPASAGMRSVAA